MFYAIRFTKLAETLLTSLQLRIFKFISEKERALLAECTEYYECIDHERRNTDRTTFWLSIFTSFDIKFLKNDLEFNHGVTYINELQ